MSASTQEGPSAGLSVVFRGIRDCRAKFLTEPLQLGLHESSCLPLLTYASGAVSYRPNRHQTLDLNVCCLTYP